MEYTLDGLKQDFPTAKELSQFVFDQIGVSLEFRGRDPKLKYEIALQALQGQVNDEYRSSTNPYVDRSDLVPMDEIPALPERSKNLPARNREVSRFNTGMIPHPDSTESANDRRVDVLFRKYDNNVLTYEILGPLEPRTQGEKLDKYGRTRPERITWSDPRTPETVFRTASGEYTPAGTGLRIFMQGRNLWHWVDRDFSSLEAERVVNPWR